MIITFEKFIQAILALLGLFVLAGCRSPSPGDRYDELYVKQHSAPSGSDLPAGGTLLVHPTNPAVIYYYTVRRLMDQMPQNAGRKEPGLYISTDKGRDWCLLGDRGTDYLKLYIHPKSGVLFAIMENPYLFTKPDGSIITRHDKTLATSTDGGEWNDINPAGVIFNPFGIVPDPDHPSRICVLAQSAGQIRVYQALTNDYSEWKGYSDLEWAKAHPTWNWERLWFQLETDAPITYDSDTAWRDQLAHRCNEVISQGSGHHDTYLKLAKVGNKESVPLLIKALRREVPPFDHEGRQAVVCTTEHCVEALRSITGEDYGFSADQWEIWWKNTGSKLPDSHFQPRLVNYEDHP